VEPVGSKKTLLVSVNNLMATILVLGVVFVMLVGGRQ
jgi:hypothetical protein